MKKISYFTYENQLPEKGQPERAKVLNIVINSPHSFVDETVMPKTQKKNHCRKKGFFFQIFQLYKINEFILENC